MYLNGDYNISIWKPFACTYLNFGDEGSTATQGSLREGYNDEGSLFRRGFYLTRRSMGLLTHESMRILAQRKSRKLLAHCVMKVWSTRSLGWCYQYFKFFAMICKIACISLSIGSINSKMNKILRHSWNEVQSLRPVEQYDEISEFREKFAKSHISRKLLEMSRYEQCFASFLKKNVVILLRNGNIGKLTKFLEFHEEKCGHSDLWNGVFVF